MEIDSLFLFMGKGTRSHCKGLGQREESFLEGQLLAVNIAG